MMEQRLSTAFQEILSGLEKGQKLEILLAAYPDLADELRPMLETALFVPQARANRQEVQAMRTRLDSQFAAQLSVLEVPKSRSRRPLWALVASISFLLLSFWFFFPRGTSENANELELTQGTLAPTASETASPSPSATATETASPSATATETVSPSPSATASLTSSPSATASKTNLPLATHTSPATIAVCSPRSDWQVYRIESGDTLSEIALNTGISLAELMTANCLDNPRGLLVGQRIYVPRLWEDENGAEDDNSEEDPTDEPDDDSAEDNSGSSDDSGSDDDNSGSDDDNSGSDDDEPDPTDEPDDD